MSLQHFLGKFYLGTSANDFAVGGTSVSLTVGEYYLHGYSGESTAQLCEHIQTKIRAIGATQDASTCALNVTTGLVTITLETAATLVFTDTALATILGMSTSYASGTSHVGTTQPRYLWRPSRQAVDFPHQLDTSNFYVPRSTTKIGRSLDGTSWAVGGYLLYDSLLRYEYLDDSEVITPATGTSYSDLQQFWIDVAHAAMPIRVYPDRTVNTSADYITCLWGSEADEEVGEWSAFAYRHVSQYNGLWDVEIPLMKYIE